MSGTWPALNKYRVTWPPKNDGRVSTWDVGRDLEGHLAGVPVSEMRTEKGKRERECEWGSAEKILLACSLQAKAPPPRGPPAALNLGRKQYPPLLVTGVPWEGTCKLDLSR